MGERRSQNIVVKTVSQCIAAARHPSVIACVSGGADSVALLLALRECGTDIKAAHCNFHLRGKESDRDRDFVKDLCHRLSVELLETDFDVETYRREKGGSIEMACRELRYGWFREIARERNARIATGHNADDNVETLLLNLFRGCGIGGLKGMGADNGEILRPLITVYRTQILEYLMEKGEPYVTDSTNLTDDYSRNFLRNQLIPLAETRWPQLKSVLLHSMEIFREEDALINDTLAKDIASGSELPLRKIRNSVAPVTIIFNLIRNFGGSETQAREIAASVRSEGSISGKRWHLPHDNIIWLEDDAIRIRKKDTAGNPEAEFEVKEIDFTSQERHLMLSDRSNACIWLPGKREDYIFRHPKKGDRMKPFGMQGSRLVSDILKEARIPAALRTDRWILADRSNDEIIWIPGIRRGRTHLVNETDRQGIRIRMR